MNRYTYKAQASRRPWFDEARASLSLSGHLLLGQVSLMLMPVMDIFAVASLGSSTLAAVGLLNSFSALLLLFCFGVMQAMAPLAGSALASADGQRTARQILSQGLLLASAMGLTAAIATHCFAYMMPRLGQEAAVVQAARRYADVLALAMLPAAWLTAWRVSYPLLGQARPLALTLIACTLLHGMANQWFVHGMGSLAGQGIAGLGWSYVLSYGLAAVCFAILDRRAGARHCIARTAPSEKPREQAWIRRLLAIGLPIGAVMAIEYTLFTGSTLLMGRHGGQALAAHAVALQWVTLAFIVPLAMSNTMLTRLSLAIGKMDPEEVRRVVWVSCSIALGFHAAIAVVYALAALTLAGWMLPANSQDREALMALTAPLMQLAALLQAFNGMAVVLAAVLRACRDTRAPLLQVFAGYWIAGLGSAWMLGTLLGPIGVWLGMCLGFGLTIVLLLRRVRRRLLHLSDIFPQSEVAHAKSR
ncbi:MATE family efflux transporter [Roseateles sp. DB2]|uniref:MATE family efflux transporter n=1 Tax=Roseateles sp. DB2 TaxID=3453717 RepID=UPI003EECC3D5